MSGFATEDCSQVDPIDASAKVFPNQRQQIKFLVKALSDKRNMPFPLEMWRT